MIEAPSDGYQRIARTVEETPDTVFVVFLLMRGRCRAYVDELESPATIVVHDLSKDPDLQVYGDWNDDVHKIIRDVNPLEINIYRTTGLPELPFYTRWSVVGALHEAGDLAYNGPARPVEDAADLDGFPSWLWKYHLKRENILSEDAVFGVYEDGECVSVATTAAVGNLYVDIASFTKVPFRKKGYASETAKAVCHHIKQMGKEPIWHTTGTHAASQGVARRAGFGSFHGSEMANFVRNDWVPKDPMHVKLAETEARIFKEQ